MGQFNLIQIRGGFILVLESMLLFLVLVLVLVVLWLVVISLYDGDCSPLMVFSRHGTSVNGQDCEMHEPIPIKNFARLILAGFLLLLLFAWL